MPERTGHGFAVTLEPQRFIFVKEDPLAGIREVPQGRLQSRAVEFFQPWYILFLKGGELF